MTASAAGSGGAVCPSTAAGGAVIYLCTAAGSGVRCARRLLRLVQSLLVLRLRCLLELVVRLLPLLCLACLACLACLVLCSVRWISSLVGVGVARPVVGSTGETWLRWRFPSPVASFSSAGKFYRSSSVFEVLDQVFLPPTSGRSFIGGASAWFCLLLWLTAFSLACGLAFAVLRGGGGFPRGY